MNLVQRNWILGCLFTLPVSTLEDPPRWCVHSLKGSVEGDAKNVVALDKTTSQAFAAQKSADGRWWSLCPFPADDSNRLTLQTISANQAVTSAPKESQVSIVPSDSSVAIDIGGQRFSEYHFLEGPRPYFHPLLGPDGVALTRSWPMAEAPGEPKDHPHHRSLWFSFGDVNGIDFWSEEGKFGRIVHVRFEEVSTGPVFGTITSVNEWKGPDGSVVCTDERTFRVFALSEERIFDFEVTIHASHGPLVFGDTKEGMMAIRLATSLQLADPGKGHILNSEGDVDGATWGKRAKWCDYSGPIGAATYGITIFDDPSNLRHPTWWHVRDYGLFAANPFGIHHFEGKPEGVGRHEVKAGESLTFRYRFHLHRGLPSG